MEQSVFALGAPVPADIQTSNAVTRAAARLALTQPTLSGMLQRLRQTFSDQLGGKIVLNDFPNPPLTQRKLGPFFETLPANARFAYMGHGCLLASGLGPLARCSETHTGRAALHPLLDKGDNDPRLRGHRLHNLSPVTQDCDHPQRYLTRISRTVTHWGVRCDEETDYTCGRVFPCQ